MFNIIVSHFRVLDKLKNDNHLLEMKSALQHSSNYLIKIIAKASTIAEPNIA